MKSVSSLLTLCGLAAASMAQAQEFTPDEIMLSMRYQGGLQVLCARKDSLTAPQAEIIEFYDNKNMLRAGAGFFMLFDKLQIFPRTHAVLFTDEVPVDIDAQTEELSSFNAPDHQLYWDDKRNLEQSIYEDAAKVFITELDKLCRSPAFGPIPTGNETYSRRMPVDIAGKLSKAAAQIKLMLGN